MIRLGLTGSIAMGKTTAAELLRQQGVSVHDSDAVVHRLLASGGEAVAPVLALFPDADDGEGGINRKVLGAQIFHDDDKRHQLEAIIHPLVRHDRESWADLMDDENHPIIVYDIPLLFETGAQNYCDYVAVISAPEWLQKTRALERPGMTNDRLEGILSAQISDTQKRQLADYVIPSGFGLSVSKWYIARMVRDILLRGKTDA
ncbi:MAG: dephospho-CoA kinase [Alphaproteobacteria bacterium]|nr:dephospho-CoA kinase [Alphaproteobacteria bacterium]